MKIEVACHKKDSTKVKGDLLESLSKELLESQGYDVIEEIRFTGVELDLLCKHKVSGKEIYVECKAQKEKIGAPILRQLLGTVAGYDYAEGWIISTSEFGKEAKGFCEMWKGKSQEKASKLSFYSPEVVIESLCRASIICKPPQEKAEKFIGGVEFLGDWSMLITSYGRFWTIYTLQGGAPFGVLVYNANNGRHIQDEDTLNNISQLETSLAEYDLKIGINKKEENLLLTSVLPNVVEVQVGDSWDDYRPARPQDFVGRDSTQKSILSFFKKAKDKSSDTRIFAITGNSGLGKSSLIAKVRDRSRNKFHKNKYFTFAVDIRGAKTPSYISASLLKCLKEAQKTGFGDPQDLQLADPSSPFSSPSIESYLNSVAIKGQVICLIFDQFEELYSKPELFGIFFAAKDLMLDVASFKGNFVLGFAWKTDSTTLQDHPAYHMWHDLSDYRKVYKLDVFDTGEINKSITTFEKEVEQKIPIEIRHQIINSSQGFPWLLKKLCINLYGSLKKGEGAESILIDLDVSRLFESDLDLLSPTEHTCLKLIAQKAPADWSEIIEISGIAVLNNLVNKRLVIKSGDRLNVYWDIFKDYLLTGNVPVVPFNYIPTSDFTSMLKVFETLNNKTYTSAEEIADKTSLKERTVWNIGADLVMLGLTERKGTTFKHHRKLSEFTPFSLLQELRIKFGKHSLKLTIYRSYAGQTINQNVVATVLKTCLPKAKFSDKTWTTYANRLSNLFTLTGYFVRAGNKIVVQDLGTPTIELDRLRKRRGNVFSPTAPPAVVIEALKFCKNNSSLKSAYENGFRNSLSILNRFELVSISDDIIIVNTTSIQKYGGYVEAIWTSTKNEATVSRCIEKIIQMPDISGSELGDYLATEYSRTWTDSSKQRNGSSLKQWACWVKEGIQTSRIPNPPGRTK